MKAYMSTIHRNLKANVGPHLSHLCCRDDEPSPFRDEWRQAVPQAYSWGYNQASHLACRLCDLMSSRFVQVRGMRWGRSRQALAPLLVSRTRHHWLPSQVLLHPLAKRPLLLCATPRGWMVIRFDAGIMPVFVWNLQYTSVYACKPPSSEVLSTCF